MPSSLSPRVAAHHITGQIDRRQGEPQFGWVVKEGLETLTESEAIGMRAERAAIYLVMGISEQVQAGTWQVIETPRSPYLRLKMLPRNRR